MPRLRRIDAELVRRKLAPSRTKAQEMIQAGYVKLDGEVVYKPARQMDPAQAIVVDLHDSPDYASRGAYKLAGALEILGEKAPQIKDRRCLDAGASTGGFTDVLLRNGAGSVVAADVGYGQLIWRLQNDSRVEVRDRTNVRQLKAGDIEPAPEVVVSDLSFISLTLVLDALKDVAAADADFLLMVKPQFEVGKEKLGAGGVVRNLDYHHEAVSTVVRYAMKIGLFPYGLAASPLPGPAGNVEYFVALKAVGADFSEGGATPLTAKSGSNRVVEFISETDLEARIWDAINAGPAKTSGKRAEGSEYGA